MSEVRNIVLLGRRNAGKSSLINIISGQEVAIVSEMPGTTTDPVRKRMEIPGVGSCNLIDTAGIDDVGEVGGMRSSRSFKEAFGADMAIVVFTENSFREYERELVRMLESNLIPFVLVHNKADLKPLDKSLMRSLADEFKCAVFDVSCRAGLVSGIGCGGASGNDVRETLLCVISKIMNEDTDRRQLIPDSLAGRGDHVVLVCPIDCGAPEGRLILPQVKTIRSLLDKNAVVTVVQPSELKALFHKALEGNDAYSGDFAKRPNGVKCVITDSQAFSEVSAAVPSGIPVGSFSILMARMKGPFDMFMDSVSEIDSLKDGDRVLILESCTHRSSCDDIGRVKIPALLRKFTGKELSFEFVSGLDDIPGIYQSVGNRTLHRAAGSGYAIAIQCGGCMVTSRQITARVMAIAEKGIPVTNYGLAIAYMKGLFNDANFRAFLHLIGK